MFFAAAYYWEGMTGVEKFLGFLSLAGSGASEQIAQAAQSNPFAGMSLLGMLALIFASGFLMNLTPCVLPMAPINLMIIGKSFTRGLLYGLGIAIAYGVLGLLAVFGGMAFGAIQGNPWFNITMAVIFIALALSLFDVFFIDFSGRRSGVVALKSKMLPGLFALFMGVVSAVLAGACVAPMLLAVLNLTAALSAQGNKAAILLPFVFSLGMALPWPFAGAGMQVLPKPGAWMKKVNVLFGIIVLGFAAWYAYLAYDGFSIRAHRKAVEAELQDAAFKLAEDENTGAMAVVFENGESVTPKTLSRALAFAKAHKKPVLVDCWATWCKNCRAMEKRTLRNEQVKEKLREFTIIRLQAEQIDELNEELNKMDELKDFKEKQNWSLPLFLMFD